MQDYVKVTFLGPKLPEQTWIEPGWRMFNQGGTLPTFVAPLVRQRPPPQPAGLATCDAATLLRYKSDSYRFPPYQYKLESGLVDLKGESWRHATPEERELLLHFRLDHTFPSLTTTDIKQDQVEHTDLRNSLLGEALHCGVVAYFCAELLYAEGFLAEPPSSDLVTTAPSSREVLSRRGDHAKAKAPDQLLPGGRWKQASVEELLVRQMLRRQTHRGGDVRSRSLLGLPMRWPRDHIPAAWWLWKPVTEFKWSFQEHINILEARSDFITIRWKLRVAANVGTRGMHLMDSQVSLGALSHGRSSSADLAPVIEKIGALTVGGCMVQLLCYTHTFENPADAGSRKL